MLSRGPVAIGSLEPGETEGIKMDKGKLGVTLPTLKPVGGANERKCCLDFMGL